MTMEQYDPKPVNEEPKKPDAFQELNAKYSQLCTQLGHHTAEAQRIQKEIENVQNLAKHFPVSK